MDKFSLKSILFSFCLISSYSLSGCTFLSFSDSNEGAKLTTGQIAASYIESSVTVNDEWLTRYLFISEYLKNQNLTKEEYASRLSGLKSRWEVNSHPLAKLKLESVSLNGNEGFATFKRINSDNKDFPLVKVSFIWTGSSWAVSDDNFLGKGELYDTFK